MAECFWTDLVGVTQECADTPPPSGLLPYRDYLALGDNGVLSVTWGYFDDMENQFPISAASGSVGLYFSGGQWNCLGQAQSYFPRAPDDRVEAIIQIYRSPREGTAADIFNGQAPDDIPAWAELVAEVTWPDLSVEESNNGNIPYKVYGPVTGVPTLDPQYQYMLVGAFNIYNTADELVSTEPYVSGAIYDQAAEVPDESGSVLAIKPTLPIDPTDFDPYDVGLIGYGVSYVLGISDGGMDDLVLLYTMGYWRGVMAEFICTEFVAAIDGGPLENITVRCS